MVFTATQKRRNQRQHQWKSLEDRIALIEEHLAARKGHPDFNTSTSTIDIANQSEPDIPAFDDSLCTSWEEYYVGDPPETISIAVQTDYAAKLTSLDIACQTSCTLPVQAELVAISNPIHLLEIVQNQAMEALLASALIGSTNAEAFLNTTHDEIDPAPPPHESTDWTSLDHFLASLPVSPESANDANMAIEKQSLSDALTSFRYAATDVIDTAHDLYDSSVEVSDLMPILSEEGSFTDVMLDECYKVLMHLEHGPAHIDDLLLFPFGYDYAVT